MRKISRKLFAVLVVFLLAACARPGSETGPIIDIWYGVHQSFGHLGSPQRWINILGTVSSPAGISTLEYSLNNGPSQTLSVGPDHFRLVGSGDFNVEIDRAVLQKGENLIVVMAEDVEGRHAKQEVIVDYHEKKWSLPYAVDWSAVNVIQDAIQVVDGLWYQDEIGLRTVAGRIGYDRVIAIGDVSWQDYEVTVPLTVHSMNPAVFGSPIDVGPAFGVFLRWQGHTDDTDACVQPHCGWRSYGAANWYSFKVDGPGKIGVLIEPSWDENSNELLTVPVEMGGTYWFKARVETMVPESFYYLKWWEGERDGEPEEWMFYNVSDPGAMGQGSFLVVAHHVDLSIGDITVTPVRQPGSP